MFETYLNSNLGIGAPQLQTNPSFRETSKLNSSGTVFCIWSILKFVFERLGANTKQLVTFGEQLINIGQVDEALFELNVVRNIPLLSKAAQPQSLNSFPSFLCPKTRSNVLPLTYILRLKAKD